jgi:hypothetical protein
VNDLEGVNKNIFQLLNEERSSFVFLYGVITRTNLSTAERNFKIWCYFLSVTVGHFDGVLRALKIVFLTRAVSLLQER